MHYPFWAFSKNGNPTLEPSSTAIGADLGQRVGLSDDDISKIETFYKCDSSTSAKKRYIQVVKRAANGARGRKGRARVKSRDKAGGKCNKAAEVQVRNAKRKEARRERMMKRKEKRKD